jgi:enhancing lycopene biosynthesis protein 2
MSKKIGVVLSGCGVFDGAEIHEAVLTLLSIQQNGAEAVMAAPNRDQAHVLNHITGEEMDETRNVLIESARIARGKISDLAEVKADQLDALVFPGGFGGAKNLCTFAFDGTAMSVDPEVERIVGEMREANKPIGFICITPALGAKLVPGATLTFGAGCDASEAIEKMGATHVETDVASITIDDANNVVSTGAYMVGPWVADVWKGIDALVTEVVSRA